MRSNPSKRQDKSSNSQDSEFIYGKHAISAHLENKNQVNKVFIQKGLSGEDVRAILAMVKEQGIVLQEVPKSKLDELTEQGNHQGIVASIPPYEYAKVSDILDLAEDKGEDPFILILDGIEDPHNLGSILRTADALGVHGVIIPKRRAVGLTGVVAKTSTGAIQHVPVARVTNLSQTVQILKDAGIWVFATAMEGEDIRQWNSQGPIALIIGNEGQGVSKNLMDNADGLITIPMVGHVQSLNAGVATAIITYEVAKHRIPHNGGPHAT